MSSFNSATRAATPVPPPKQPATAAEATESAAGEEDPGSALDTQPDLRQAVEDENADPVGDGHSDAELAAVQPPAAPPRPEPARQPSQSRSPATRSDDNGLPQEDKGDAESHKPGRD